MPERPFSNPYLNLALRFLGVLVGFYGYSLVIQQLGGFATGHIYYQWLEILLVLYFYGLFYFLLKPFPWRGLLAAVPILLVYLVHDVFFLVYGKVFRFINVKELPELLQILPLYYSIALALIFLIPLGLILWHADYRRRQRIGLWLMPLALLVLAIHFSPTAFASSFRDVAHEIVKYSDSRSVENNGRLAMLFFREAQRISVVDHMAPYRQRTAYDAAFNEEVSQLAPQINHHNVHLIILESFLDPTLFRDLRFSQSPMHPDFAKLVGKQMGLTISPVFGGSTSQAEFEALCGVPALERLSSVEFNVFTGSAAHCLPDLLAHEGYRSVASNAFKPNFFNTLPAYKGLGFRERYFPKEYAAAEQTYLHAGNPGDEEFMFDGKLFEQNRAFVAAHLQQHRGQPLFNYLLTIYGHTPHILDPQQRPEFITLKSTYPDDHLTHASNQFYYRTQALAQHINALIKMDPHSLIIFMSDHVPPLRNGPNTYNALHYMNNIQDSIYYNRIAIFVNGKIRKYPTLHHYDVYAVILDYLTDGAYCKEQACAYLQPEQKPREAYLPAYLRLMAHASE
ncbi:MAG: sulfatase-like hydrolase/transferase [Gammaproteobacteria bacterium]|nr:sulfatase-like hydrolase/transferase [Gammaproteobacteria bacterium]